MAAFLAEVTVEQRRGTDVSLLALFNTVNLKYVDVFETSF